MSLTPITLSDLDNAGAVDPDNDLLLIRQGFADRKISPGNLGNIRMGTLDLLPGQAVATDLLLIARQNGPNYDNYAMPPQYLGFLNNTTMWFFNNSAPLGWTIVPNSGDRVLATAIPGGASYQYSDVGYAGNWQQENHTLTVAELPSHNHPLTIYRSDVSGQDSNKIGGSNRATNQQGSTGFTGGGLGHNHGDTWRPMAAVGLLCTKNLPVGG